ncbi:MAG: translocation/assembly module TamB domain-containing protein [Betaproteobacteria bacterium]
MNARRTLLRCTAAIAVLGACALAAALWVLQSETALHWGVSQLAGALPCRLTVDGLEGAIGSSVRARSIVCENAAMRIEARQVVLAWNPLALVRKRLEIAQLSAARLSVASLVRSDAPPSPPDSLALPFAVDAPDVRVGTLMVTLPDSGFTVGEIDAAWSGDQTGHQLVLRRLATPWAVLRGEGRIGAARPLPVEMTLNVDSQVYPEWPLALTVRATGPLIRLTTHLAGRAGSVRLGADVEIAPFDRDPLGALSARATGLDLATLDPRAPHTSLDADFAGAATGTTSIEGRLSARNAQPGSLDAGRLPVRELVSTVGWSPSGVRFTDARLRLAGTGVLTGSGRISADGAIADVVLADVDLRALHATLHPTRLRGNLAAATYPGRQTFRVDLRQDALGLQGEATLAGDRLTVSQARLQAGSAVFAGSGVLALSGDRAFALEGVLSQFDPARFGAFPHARLNARVDLAGSLAPTWRAAMRYRLGQSSFRGLPLAGAGKLTISPSRVSDADAEVRLADATLSLRGALGEPGDSMDLVLDVPRLGSLQRPLEGRLRAWGSIGGTPGQPRVDLRAQASDLRLGEVRIAQWQTEAHLGAGSDPPLRLDTRLTGLSKGSLSLEAVTVMADGRRSGHDLRVTARGSGLDLEAAAQGGLDLPARRWTGSLLTLANKGAYAFDLVRPASLDAGPGSLALGNADVRYGGGLLRIAATGLEGNRLRSSGSFTGFPVALLLTGLPQVRSTMTLAGKWNLAVTEHLDAMVDVTREAGDLELVAGDEHLPLGITNARLALAATDRKIAATVNAAATGITLQGHAETAPVRRAGRWQVDGNAPLQLNGSARLASLRPILALLGENFSGDGAVTAKVSADGTLAQPNLRGTLDAAGLRFEEAARGILLRDGTLHAQVTDQTLTLTEFRIAGSSGFLEATGRARRRGDDITASLDWRADRLKAVQHPDLQLTVSGQGRIIQGNQAAEITGSIHCDQGRVELRSGTAPALGTDVVVAGRRPSPALNDTVIRSRVAIGIDLGRDFLIRGHGLAAGLEGKIELASAGNAALQAKGEISLHRGTFDAYGQRLEIDRGFLYFAGPIDNPGLDFRALRRNQPVEAGVEITGTARNPRARLVSTPNVPDPEKLAWLVLGQRVATSGTSEAETMQNAALALAAGVGTAPLQRQLAQAVGLDEIRLAPSTRSGTTSGVVTAGKRLGDRIYVTYERTLATAADVLRMTYQLTRRWSVRTESGTSNAVDLLFTLSFD